MTIQETICIASDHAGFEMKEMIRKKLELQGYQVKDFGTYSKESVDYPDFIQPLAEAINQGGYLKGIILCGTGNGVSMTANKYPGVRAALCWKEEIARMARLHNDANILALPARYINETEAAAIVDLFLSTPFEGGRHCIRVQKINKKEG
jgi:ribose 5-phosphate isomerase B